MRKFEHPENRSDQGLHDFNLAVKEFFYYLNDIRMTDDHITSLINYIAAEYQSKPLYKQRNPLVDFIEKTPQFKYQTTGSFK